MLPEPTEGRSLWSDPAFVPALAVAVIIALGFGLVVPILPLFAADFGVGVFAVTVVISVFAAVRLVSNLFAGQLADRIGTRLAVAGGAMVVGASSLLTAFAPSYGALVAFRGVGGFGSALFFTALLTHVVRVVAPSHRGRAVGMLQGSFLFGLTAGPLVGGLLAEPLGLRGPFVVYAVACVAGGLVALRLPEPDPAVQPGVADAVDPTEGGAALPSRLAAAARRSATDLLVGGRRLCRDQAFVAALVMMVGLRWAATGVRFSLIPLYGEDVVGLSPSGLGVALALAAIAQLAVLWPAGRASDLIGRRAVSVPAYLLFAVVSAMVVLASTPVAFGVGLVAYGAATGLASVTPPAVVADVTPGTDTGLGIGALNTAGDLGSTLGPLLSGALVDVAGYGAGFASASVVLFAGAGWAWRMRETLPSRQPVATP